MTLVALLAALAAAAPGPLAEVRARLAQPAVLAGRFVQHKRVAGLKKPLTSSGRFVVAKGQGVRWLTERPFPSELVVRPEDIVSRQGAAEVFRLEAAKVPAVRLINGVLFALLSGDLAALEQHFDVVAAAEAAGWTLRLTPKEAGLRKVLSGVTLTGDEYVRRVELAEAGGDGTTIEVQEPHAEPGGW